MRKRAVSPDGAQRQVVQQGESACPTGVVGARGIGIIRPMTEAALTNVSAVDETAFIAAPRPSYRLTRFVMLRLLGLVYLCAFLVAAFQAVPLLGHDGLLPADAWLRHTAEKLGSRWAGFEEAPSLFWLGISDRGLEVVAWSGAALSAVVLAGFANAPIMCVLWALYMSIVHVGQLWYGYGWEILLLETGFLGIFLAPSLDPRPFPARPPAEAVLWLYRWLIFRIMFGAGLIKLRGDPCWRDLTCLYYHYETQPVPNPLSPLLHFMPRWFHNAGVLYNHVAELIAPFMAFGPRRVRHIGGGIMLVFQCILILSGNLSFLNWLTIVPIFSCFDDSLLERVLPARLVSAAVVGQARVSRAATWVTGGVVVVVALLSVNPLANMLSPGQVMNRHFDPLALVNTYGAFGHVGKERNEIVFEGTRDPVVTPQTKWTPYEFKCKPGDPDRHPCLMSPYHYRLDWQIWFAAMTTPDHAPWTLHFIWKLLHHDRRTLGLLARDPFPDGPPTFIRAQLYRYEYARIGENPWWNRTLLGPWFPPLAANQPQLVSFLQAYGWVGNDSDTADATDDDG